MSGHFDYSFLYSDRIHFKNSVNFPIPEFVKRIKLCAKINHVIECVSDASLEFLGELLLPGKAETARKQRGAWKFAARQVSHNVIGPLLLPHSKRASKLLRLRKTNADSWKSGKEKNDQDAIALLSKNFLLFCLKIASFLSLDS